MNCKTVQDQLTDYLTGQIDEAVRDAFNIHIRECPVCQARLHELETAWHDLGTLPRHEPSPLLRQRFYAMLEQERPKKPNRQKGKFGFGHLLGSPRLALTAAIFLMGLFLGYEIGGHRLREGRLLELGQEVQSIKQQMSISMLQQQSSFERMKGVRLSTEVSQPGDLLIQMLFSKINADPSVPVRLAAIDAIALFSDREDVQTLLINSLLNQDSPLVQIAIIDQLTYVREKTALTALKMLIENQDTQPDVKRYAEKTLQEIS
jgi:hypothetical protein